MSLLLDVLIILVLVLAAYAGARRGLALVLLEIIGLVLSTALAALVYRPAAGLVGFTGLSDARSRLLAYVLIWVVIEICFALVVRGFIMPRVAQRLGRRALPASFAGAANVFKVFIVIMVAIVAYVDLPFAPTAKEPIQKAAIPKFILEKNLWLVDGWRTGPGRDITESLSVFVVTTDPESRQRIELGFKTTSVRLDEADERAMLDLVNRERTQRGLGALALNEPARSVARNYSRTMLAQGFFSHIDNDGHNPFDRMRAAGVRFGAAGENLALAPNLRRAHIGLMNSPGHRANILSPNYRAVGIGIIDAGPYGIMVSQEFTD